MSERIRYGEVRSALQKTARTAARRGRPCALPSALIPFMLSILLIICSLRTAGAAVEPGALQRAVQTLEADAAEAHLPTLAAAIVSSSDVLFQHIWGDDADDKTPFLLGSLSKSFTALAVMTLVEDGLVDLDAPVTQYVRRARTNATVRELLTHTSGIGTYDTPLDYTSPARRRGTHEYANVNYAILSQLIEAVSGEDYEDYMRERIFEPLELTDTYADPADARREGLVQGHTNILGLQIPAGVPRPNAASWIQPAAGYIASSLADMEKYLQMYLRGGEDIVSQDSVEQMLNDGVPVEDDPPYLYAFGWTRIDAPLPVPVYRHAGLVETGMTCMYLIPSLDIGAVLLANTNDYLVGTDIMDRAGWNMVLALLGETPGAIDHGEYARSHLAWDLIYLAVLSTAVVPFLFLGRALRRKTGPRSRRNITAIVLYFFGYPTALLLLVPALAGVPLWVIGDFVPDLYGTLIATAVLLYAGGAIRLAVPPLRNLHAGPQ